MAQKLGGEASGNVAEVDVNKNLFVRVPGADAGGVERGGGSANAPAMFSEVDSGARGVRKVLSPEVDLDYAMRFASKVTLEDEVFGHAAQNTGKVQYNNTTMTATWATGGLTVNGGNIVTTTTGANVRTYGFFPIFGNGAVTYAQFQLAFSQQPSSNQTVDFGLFQAPTANPFAPTDGVYFRLDSTGLKAVINNNGSEVAQQLNGTGGTLNATYTNNNVRKYTIAIGQRTVLFWVDDVLAYEYNVPVGLGTPCLSSALPLQIRHAIVGGAAGSALQTLVKAWGVSVEGIPTADTLGGRGNGIFGSYQGLSGGTMGSLSAYTNNTNPTAAVPSNTALTANLPSGLGGQAWETLTLTVNTDGILMSYQVPAGTVSTPGKRLKVSGVKLSSFVQTVVAGGPLNRTFNLNYGHTAVSLATAEAAATKARRVVLLPELTQVVTAAQAVNTMVSQPGGCVSLFPEPIYVNPGEFISLSVKHIGTVGTSGTIATNIQYIYSWE